VAAPDLAVAAAGTWTTRRDMPSIERTSVAAAAVNQGGQSVLYVIGGRTSTGASLGKLQAYHVARNRWTYHPDMPTPVYETNGAGTINGKVYVSGGLVNVNGWVPFLFMFDPATNRWTKKRDMPEPTSGGVTAVFKNQLYVLTHCGGDCEPSNDLPRFLRYDPATDTWTSLPPPPNAHHYGVAGFMAGKFHVTGGIGIGDPKQLDVYDPATNQWTTRAPLSPQRTYAVGVAHSAKLYVIGGYKLSADGTSATPVRTVSIYDPATNRWTTGTPLPSARVDVGGSRVLVNGNGRIEVVGGRRPGNNLMYTP
jgi:N-acetylneuraminic acid mutarotase